ncbi:MAG: 50S ribosomal protein L3 [Candidatus Omnitrophica bacterium ADurb.Bin292]|jgi:large subunit ribosomal protein L3|nr:MAG: 50S ribosomal protein L3 [Candidatus Omnitrophica bacterium ADurb.Bin292]HPW76917.1 50S ribosomal protein L3 [Candidatus Omnitrophota bacterium]HQB12072.1 50S ribosomal protein L3 [Candidatus Omnitrophota bacterium]
MLGLLGKKIGMSRIFDEGGTQVPVTLIEVGPCFVTGIRTKEKNGYQAVQIGFDVVKERKLTKSRLGATKKIGVPPVNVNREIRTENLEGLDLGSEIRVDNFEAGEFVDVVGTSIGKGFQGVVKRLGYKGGASKGHGSMFGRQPGSIGSQSGSAGARKKVRKGKGLPGHLGNERVTVHNVKVMKVDPENNLLVVKGSVPGFEGGYVFIKTSLKRGSKNKWKVSQQPKEAPVASPDVSAEKKEHDDAK